MRGFVVLIAALAASFSIGHAQLAQTGAGKGTPVGCSPSNTQTTTWKAAVIGDGGTVSDAQCNRIDTFISCMKGGGSSSWSTLDRLWPLASENTFQAGRDLVGANAFTSISGSPTFTASQGYTGNGTSSVIDTGWKPATGPNFSTDAAAIFVYQLTASTGLHFDMGVYDGTVAVQAIPGFAAGAGNDFSNVNTTTFTANGTTTASRVIYSRTTHTLTTKYVNGSSTDTDSSAGISPPNANMFVLARNNTTSSTDGFSDHKLAMVSMGGALSSGQAANLDGCANTYVTSLP